MFCICEKLGRYSAGRCLYRFGNTFWRAGGQAVSIKSRERCCNGCLKQGVFPKVRLEGMPRVSIAPDFETYQARGPEADSMEAGPIRWADSMGRSDSDSTWDRDRLGSGRVLGTEWRGTPLRVSGKPFEIPSIHLRTRASKGYGIQPLHQLSLELPEGRIPGVQPQQRVGEGVEPSAGIGVGRRNCRGILRGEGRSG